MNNSEEEAKELYFKFKSGENHILTPKQAKQCALIDVQNTLEELGDLWDSFDIYKMHGSQNKITTRIRFYQKVKEAITKLI